MKFSNQIGKQATVILVHKMSMNKFNKKMSESVVYLCEYPPVLAHDRYPFFQQRDWLF